MSLQDLQKSEDKWVTKMGKVFPTERAVYRGKDLHQELKDLGWFELFLYGITGRFFTKNQLKMLNFIWTCTSYPDPCIWNNRVASLTGTTRSTINLALGAATAVSEAELYGPKVGKYCLDFLIRLSEALSRGYSVEQFVNQELQSGRKIYGYGRPLVDGDERVPHILNLLKEVDMDKGPFVCLVFEVEKILKAKKGLVMNMASICGGIAADMGLSPNEFQAFTSPLFTAGFIPCFLEAAEKPMGTLFPLKCSRLVYEGRAPRRRLVDWKQYAQEKNTAASWMDGQTLKTSRQETPQYAGI